MNINSKEKNSFYLYANHMRHDTDFWNKEIAELDIKYWSYATILSADEATAICFKKDPRVVNSITLEDHHGEDFTNKYYQLKNIIDRKIYPSETIKFSEFLDFVIENDYFTGLCNFPTSLINQYKNRQKSSVEKLDSKSADNDSLSEFAKLREENSYLKSKLDKKEVKISESKVLSAFIGMLKIHYGTDNTGAINAYANKIEADLIDVGKIRITDDTIGKYVKISGNKIIEEMIYSNNP